VARGEYPDGVDGQPMQREFRFSQVFNFRDLGGHPTADGRTVRWRRLFRSDALSGLTPEDRRPFQQLAIRTVLDLRLPDEIARDGRVPPWDGLTYRNIPPQYPAWELNPYHDGLDPARYLADRYREMADNGAAQLAGAVATLADSAHSPTVVHCKFGKDRTGVVCALLLSLLGVPDEHIDADYTRSTAGNEESVAWTRRNGQPDLVMRPHWRSHPGTMLMFLSELRERHGSVERYLAGNGLARDHVTALRTHLLFS
jgi:protein-tyrosine phosphatase